VVVVVADDDVAIRVEGKVFGAVEFGCWAGAVVAGVASFSRGVDDGVNAAVEVDLAEGMTFA